MQTKRIRSERTISTRQVPNDSNEFLKRVERQRLDSECLRPLDLRSYVKQPCKRFSYRGRTLWLDPEAHQLFLDGLKKNAGVFTVETYESILRQVAGEVTKSAQVNKTGNRDSDTAGSQTIPVSLSSSAFVSDRAVNNLAIDLSYFEKRVYDRFKISLNMDVIWNGQTYEAETRDISQSGLQLRVKTPIDISESDLVRVDVMPSVGRQLDHPELDYRVVRIRRLLNDTLLALQCIESEAKDGLTVISDHIKTSTKAALAEQTDPEDALLTAQALLAERFYMRSTSILPFFIFECQDGESPLRIIFGNQVNRRSLNAFGNSQGNYDFTSMITPKRIKLLTRLALRDSKADTLMAVYLSPEHAEPQVIADLECKNYKHWCRLVTRYSDQPGFRVFKIVARVARRPVEMRIEDALEPLSDQSDRFVREMLMDAKTLSIVGAMIDVTDQALNCRRNDHYPDHNVYEEPIINSDDLQSLEPPQMVPIHYIQENRSEDRFLGQMQVEVAVAGRLYLGKTRDVSAHGLSVEITDPNLALVIERKATITFPKLEARSSSMARIKGTFRNVPAEIVGGPADGEQLLRLKISDASKGRQFSNAFSGFLAKRQSGLLLETSHTLRAATSRLYSSIFIESSSTLPVFIYCRSQNDWTFRLGITASPSPLVSYFEVADGEFDFSVLAMNGRLQRIMQEATEQGSAEIILYLSRERRGSMPEFEIKSLAEFEISDETQRTDFVHHAMDNDFRCVKIVVNHPDVPPKAEVEQAIDRLVQLSPGRCERLKTDFDNLIAIGDVVDITGLVEDVWNETPTPGATEGPTGTNKKPIA
ncbi:MAG: PilZ domain-containing protein [Candidatus Thiodiazotropha sp. (ex. Lucinisca nassula)]|nr:PilZ domain-containing protein [Candidatus Thiodiazotropha sp. (ex. Lucinisca nassula)]